MQTLNMCPAFGPLRAGAFRVSRWQIKERLDRRLFEVKKELDAAMKARNFMQCLALQKVVDQLKFERKNIPGLSEEMLAIERLQGFGRFILAMRAVRERRFLRLLPPPPWQTHRCPNSGVTYYFNPYTDQTTWDREATGGDLRRKLDR